LVFLVVAVSVVCALAVSISTQARAGGNGAAVVRDDGLCLTSDNTGSSWLFSCKFQIVTQPNGAITQYITGSVPPGENSSPLPSRAVTDVAGGPCLAYGGVTYTYVVAGVVTPSGQVTLTCKS
jgi:hypothetical protein